MTSSSSTSREPRASSARRAFYYLTAAITGAAIMVIEVLGARMLAPYVGTSHFVWTSQIAVTLAALASGYYLGGRIADRRERPDVLYGSIIAAGMYLCGAIFIVRPVAFFCLQFELALGSLLASLVLFFAPLCLLAMVGPFLVRATMSSVEELGGTVGGLSATSTVGSFIGTALIGYILVPYLPISTTMLASAAVIVALGASYFAIWGTKRSRSSAGVVVAAVLLAFQHGEPPVQGRELARRHSNFGLLQVVQLAKGGNKLGFLSDFLLQNTYDVAQKRSASAFSYVLEGLVTSYAPRARDVLVIGMGVGIVPMDLARRGARVDVVEINSAILPIAEEFFDFDAQRVRTVWEDGRAFLNRSRKLYDAIVVDAFLGDSSPSHLMTREAMSAMRARLRPDGVVIMNSFGLFDDGRDFVVSSLFKTLSAVFPHVRIHNERNGTNAYFVAGMSPLSPPAPAQLGDVHPELRSAVATALSRIVEANGEHGIVLSDDFNPVEFHDAAVREQIRAQAAEAMRTQLELPGDAPSATRPAVQLVILGDLAGVLEPCGCTSRPAGGIDRVVAAVAAIRSSEPATMLVATGDLWHAADGSALERQQDTWRMDVLGALLARLRPEIIAPGPSDRTRGAPRLRTWMRANASVSTLAGDPAALEGSARSTLLERAGLKLGFTAVHHADLERQAEPARAQAGLERELDALRARGAQITVALIHAADSAGVASLAQHSSADVVIRSGGVEAQPAAAVAAGTSRIVAAPRHGESLLVLELWPAPDRPRGWRLLASRSDAAAAGSENLLVARERALGADAARDPDARNVLDQLFRRINAFNGKSAVAVPEREAKTPGEFYLGAQSCAACHTEAYVWWRSSAHGRAFQTLVQRGRELDLDCVGCHVTGYERPGGATLAELERLQGVGCESCHGAGSAHADNPRGKHGGVARAVGAGVCAACHDREHSSGFDYEQARGKLMVAAHGVAR